MEGKHGLGTSGGFHGYEQQFRRIQGENEYLRERIKSCDRGMVSLWQMLHSGEGSSQRGRNHQYYRGSGSPKSESHYRGDEHVPKQVSWSELKESLQNLLVERSERGSQLEDMKRVTEAAKRERVLAIDEKDKLLSKYHLTKVALERKEAVMNELEDEREKLIAKCREQEDSVAALKQVNEEARQTRLMALDERAKVIEERNQLQMELSELQSERDRLFEEKVQLKGSLQELLSERRQLQQEVENARNKCSLFETVARKLKEQNEVLCEREMEGQMVKMERDSQSQAWGFSIEGGQGSEYFSKDCSIVVTGIATGSPAQNVLRFGDRLLSVNGQDFRCVSRKKAAEVLRSCDQLSITMEISRIISKLKPRAKEVHIRGKKTFGFRYETRLFVSDVEEGSAAAECLLPGDEIVQVLGKPAINLKLSHFKQIVKSCRGGISMVIHRMPGNRRPQQRGTVGSNGGGRSGGGVTTSLTHSTLTLRGIREGGVGSLVSDYVPYPSMQTPGTPGSNLSETTGYYSTQSTSLPSVCSAAISPGTPEIKTGMMMSSFTRRTSPSLNLKSVPSQTSTSQHSGYETDQDMNSHFRDSSLSSSTANSSSVYTTSPRVLGDISNPYAPSALSSRPLYHPGNGPGGGGGSSRSGRGRISSQSSSYGGSSQLSSSILSPKSDAMASSSSRFAYSSSSRNNNNHHQLPSPSSLFSSSVQRNSFSVDNLESSRGPHPRNMSSDNHVTSSSSTLLTGGPHSVSTNNIYRMEIGKRTNV